MSGKEYVFHARRKGVQNPSIQATTPVAQDTNNQENVKEIIMQQYDHYESLKKSNERVSYIVNAQEKISKEFTESFSQFQKSEDQELRRQLGDKLNHLTDLQKKLENEYQEIMKKELDILYQKWPGIFNKFVEGVDRETLEHVLSSYEKFKSGKISSNEAVMTGMDYMTERYHLPSDFFNKSAVDQFNKNIHKLS